MVRLASRRAAPAPALSLVGKRKPPPNADILLRKAVALRMAQKRAMQRQRDGIDNESGSDIMNFEVHRGPQETPPQGGEARICFTMFLSLVLSVFSAVVILYSVVIVYTPCMRELRSGLVGPKVCTTLEAERGLNKDMCEDGAGRKWSSCEEWCLGVTYETCSHVYASVREPGANLELAGCDLTTIRTCNLLEEQPNLNCKIRRIDTDDEQNPGAKETCKRFDAIQIECLAGICRNISAVYECDFESALETITARDEANCAKCPQKRRENEALCRSLHIDESPSLNETTRALCAPCDDCWTICHRSGRCFDMKSHRDTTTIGKDEYGRPVKKYYDCRQGQCSEISNLKCQRRCEGTEVDLQSASVVVFHNETLLSFSSCESADAITSDGSSRRLSVSSRSRRGPPLAVACSRIDVLAENRSLRGVDCVDGAWIDVAGMTGPLNYSELNRTYAAALEDGGGLAIPEIPTQSSLIVNERTKLKINLDGCVNTLSFECADFYRLYGRDGRNATARSVFSCYYDAENGLEAVTKYDPAATLRLLTFFACVPTSVFVITCAYLCFCNRAVKVGSDGRMRLWLAGKCMTGIGKVKGMSPEELMARKVE